MEIKTTRDIERTYREKIVNAKDLDRIHLREKYADKKWIAVDNLVKWIKENKIPDNQYWYIEAEELIEQLRNIGDK